MRPVGSFRGICSQNTGALYEHYRIQCAAGQCPTACTHQLTPHVANDLINSDQVDLSLTGLNVYSPANRQAYTYLLALAITVVLLIGAIVFYLIQNQFADYGTWYLVDLGATAIVFALFVPRGLWGTVEARFHIRLLPIGYVLREVGSGTTATRGRLSR